MSTRNADLEIPQRMAVALLVCGAVLCGCSRPTGEEAQASAVAVPDTAVNSNISGFVEGQPPESAFIPTEAVVQAPPVSAAKTNEPTTQPNSIRVEAISEGELATVGHDYQEKSTWRNAGLGSIEGVVQSYYWAIREGNERCLSNCLSQSEQRGFSCKAEQNRGYLDQWLSGACLTSVAGYTFTSAVKIEGYTQTHSVVSLSFSMADGTAREEYLNIVKENDQFKIDGAFGRLMYGHSPGHLPMMRIMQQIRKQNEP
jgi:hypothetical protein